MALHNNMMVANGIGEEIRYLLLVGKSDKLLSAAEIGLRLILHEFTLGHETAREVARHLENGDRAFLHKASDACTYARFIMRIQLIAFHHIERYRTMCKEHLTRLWINVGRVGLKTGYPCQRPCNHHRQHGRHIALTACHIAEG